MKERIPTGLKGLLAAGLYIFLALTVAALTLAPASAAETVDTSSLSVEELAHMDTEGASPELREAILRARAQIVYSKAWTVNGAGSIRHKDGTEEKLPEFSDLFPGWDLGEIQSVFAKPHEPISSELPMEQEPGNYAGRVYLEKASGLGEMGTFYSFNAQKEMSYAWAQSLPVGMDSCNIEFINLDTGKSEGLFTNVKPQQAVSISTRENVRYGVRTSSASDSAEGTAVLCVSDDPNTVPQTPQATVKVSPWAKETVERATALGLLSPLYVANKEDFTVPITRNEFCELAVSYVELQNNLGGFLNEMMETYQYERNTEGKYVVPFTDLANYAVSNQGCVPYTAYYLGITLGDNNHAYNGASSIVREEAAAVLFRAYAVCGGELPAEAAELTFSDKDTIQDWAKDNVAALLEWNVMNGKDNGNFDPRGLCTYEEAVAMFLRLYDNAPVSRAQGNVELVFSYDACMEYLQNTEVSHYRVVDTVEGPEATYVRCNTSGMMRSSSSLLLVYRDGGIQQIDTGIRVGMSGLPTSAKVENAQFSEDGKTFSCDVGIEDSYPDMLGQVSIVYHVTVNVDTLETVVTQNSTTPV